MGAIFKNEEHAIVEWIEHYLLHGADHFYLIDDDSTDSSVALLAPYIERGQVTLFQPSWGRYLGRQRSMYNHYFLPLLVKKNTQWLLIVDLDEFVWSPRYGLLTDFLQKMRHLAQIQMSVTIFGSNGHSIQPPSIVGGFTRRSAAIVTPSPACFKYFVNSDYEFTSLNVHHADFVREEDELMRFQRLGDPWLRLNHYSCQSREIWKKIKLTRGDCDEYLSRNEDHWRLADQNDIEDKELAEQNASVIARLGSV